MQLHPSQISPGESFDIFYFIRNHTDSTTYYVQAKVYDVRTGEVLLTTNLTQSSTNARLFSATVQSPADSVGYGRNIVAIASVYTDNGYTTKSQDYEEQEQYFLIKAELPMLGGGGVDYRALKDIVDEALDSRFKALAPYPELPTEALFGAIGALQREINRIPKDLPQDQPDPFFAALDEAKRELATKIVSLSKATDITSLKTDIAELQSQVASLAKSLTALNAITKESETELKRLSGAMTMRSDNKPVTINFLSKAPDVPLKSDIPSIDIRSLMEA